MRRGIARRKIVFGLMIVVVLALVVLALGPTLVNMGLGRSAIEDRIAGNINGDVELRQVRTSWFGGQTIGVRVFHEDGTEAADLDLSLTESLMALLTAGTESVHLSVEGTIKTRLEENGHLDLLDLLKPSSPDEPSALASMQELNVQVGQLDIEIVDQKAGRTLDLLDLEGELRYSSGAPITFEGRGRSKSGDLDGRVTLSLSLDRFLDAAGRVMLADAGVDAELEVSDFPVLMVGSEDRIQALFASVQSERLGDRLDLVIDGQMALQSNAPSRFEGELAIDRPMDEAGVITVGLDSITGSLTGTNVPTAMLQPMLAQTPIDAIRDVGPLAEFSAAFAGARSKTFIVTARASNLEFEARGQADAATQEVRGNLLKLQTRMQPDLIEALADVRVGRDLPLSVELTSFTLPPRGVGGVRPWSDVAASGTIDIESDEPVAVSIAEADEPVTAFSRLHATFQTDRLGDELIVRGDALTDFGAVLFEERIENLVDADGRVRPDRALPEGTTRINDIPGAVLARFAPDDTGMVASLLDEPCQIVVNSTIDGDAIRFDVGFNTPGLILNARGRRSARELVLEQSGARVVVSPELANLAQGERENPLELSESTIATIELDELRFPGASWTVYDFWNASYSGTLTLGPVRIARGPGLDEAVQLTDGSVAFQVDASTRAATGRGRIGVELEQPDSRLATWLGRQGEIGVELGQVEGATVITLTPEWDRLAGTFTARITDQAIEISGRTERWTLAPERIGVTRTSTFDGSAHTQTGIAGDIPAQLVIDSLSLPRALLAGEPFDPAEFDLAATMTGGPITVDTGGQRSRIDSFSMTVTGSDLSRGIEFEARAIPEAATGNADESSPDVVITGAVSSLVDDSGRLDASRATVKMDADINDLPTTLLDSAIQFDGLLVAVMGETFSATAVADQLSMQGGTAVGDVQSPHARGHFDLVGGGMLLKTPEDGILEGELEVTPELTSHALFRGQPILGDVRITAEPVRVRMAHAAIPLDGDISKLMAEFDIELGDVEFDAGASVFSLLSIFDPGASTTVPGRVEPIHGRIEKGVVSYDEFNVTVDRYTMPFSGKIDLVNRTVDMRTIAPLAGLGDSIRELRGIAPSIRVPIVIRGPFDSVTSEIDPDFSLDQIVLDAGLFKILTDLLGDSDDPLLRQLVGDGKKDADKPADDPLGDLIQDLLGGGKKDDKKGGGGKPGGGG